MEIEIEVEGDQRALHVPKASMKVLMDDHTRGR